MIGRLPPSALINHKPYEWLYVIGVICPSTGQSVGLLAPAIHAEMVNASFEQFSIPHALTELSPLGCQPAQHDEGGVRGLLHLAVR